MKIELMTENHWPAVRQIYSEGINTGNATFEDSPPESWENWSEKHFANCSIVCLDDSRVMGWAAISPVSSRCVYEGVAEVSVYVSREEQGKGIGYVLLKELIQGSEDNGIWTLQAGIFPENSTSLDLHQKLGFEIIGTRKRIGKMAFGPYKGEWRDVVLLERRSQTIGIN